MLIDTHTHVNMKAFELDENQVLLNALEKNIWLVNVGTKYETSKKAVEIAERYDEGVYAALAIHPIHLHDDIEEFDIIDGKEYKFTTKKQEFDYEKFKELALSSSKVVAIGETGLDVYRMSDDKKEEVLKVQEDVFRQSIRLAKELDLAVIVHGRGQADNPTAIYDRIIEILEEEKPARVVAHCFGGTLEQGVKLAQMGYYVGITGIVTFKNAKMVADLARWLPLENIVIETDAPYLAPDPYRGKRNEPSYVEFVARKIAEIRGVDYEKVAYETTVNARRLFII